MNKNNNLDKIKQAFKKLPSVDRILRDEAISRLFDKCSRAEVLHITRKVLEKFREKILSGEFAEIDYSEVISEILRMASEQSVPNLRRVINATGVVLHTNLGRAVLCESACESVLNVARNYCNLELNLVTGKRGHRYDAVEEILTRLTGAESALVVNNNAAAVLLALNTMAEGKEVIVSRGQLVEIGGSFRIPDVMEQSGAKLVEVGTTNKTYVEDYEDAITDDTALLLNVHTSNYCILGFTHTTTIKELAKLGGKYGLPVMSDLGSGCLIDLSKFGLPHEPVVKQVIEDGADIITFSGDKLLGGPQAGIVLGKKEYIEDMKKNPLTRALRIDKMTIAALEATLREYLDEERAVRNIPVLKMLVSSKEVLKKRALKLAELLDVSNAIVEFSEGASQVGGGALPQAVLLTSIVVVKPKQISVENLAKRLRMLNPAVIARIHKDSLLLDVRTVEDEEINLLADALKRALQE